MKFSVYLVTWFSGTVSLNCTCLHPSVHGKKYLLKNPKLSLEIKDISPLLLLFSSQFQALRTYHTILFLRSCHCLLSLVGIFVQSPALLENQNFHAICSLLALETSVGVLSIWTAVLLITMGSPSGSDQPKKFNKKIQTQPSKQQQNQNPNIENVQTGKFFCSLVPSLVPYCLLIE